MTTNSTYRDKHKKLGLCVRCPKKARPGRVTCKHHKGYQQRKIKWKKQEIK